MKKKISALLLSLVMIIGMTGSSSLAGAVAGESPQDMAVNASGAERSSGLTAAQPAPVWPNEGAINLNKDAQAVQNSDPALWEVALTIQGKNYQTTSDVVLVIDCSGSMNDNGRLAITKGAAKAFADAMLTQNSSTRIALVTYSESASSNRVFYTDTNRQELKNAIDAITPNGGTNQQAGIHMADDLLYSAASTGKLKNMVILSDGYPTFSFPFVASATYSGCYSRHGEYSGQYGGKITNVGTFAPDYNETIGLGYSYSLNYNAFVDATCSHNYTQRYEWGVYAVDGTVTETRNTNNGVATIWEANQSKAKGATIYSISLQGEDTAQYVLGNCASDKTKGYFEIAANEQNIAGKLGSAFTAIAGSIAIAASNGIVTDPMGDSVNLAFSGAAPVITTNIIAYNAGSANVYISQGSATYNANTDTILWNVGNVNEGNNPIMKYKVRIDPNANPQPHTHDTIPVNKTTTFDYTDYQNHRTTAQFPIPNVTVGGGTILVHWYRVNTGGQPVNANGVAVDSPNLAQQLQTAVYFQSNGKTGLDYGTYTVTPTDFSALDFVYYGYKLNSGALIQASSAAVTLNAASSNQHVWFAYALRERFNLTITKSGAQVIDENQSFLFHVTGTDEKTRGIDFTVAVNGNGSVTIAGLLKGSYTITENAGWSWRYTPDNNGVKTITPTDIRDSAAAVAFNNSRASGPAGTGWKWLDGCAYTENNFNS